MARMNRFFIWFYGLVYEFQMLKSNANRTGGRLRKRFYGGGFDSAQPPSTPLSTMLPIEEYR